MTDTSLDALFMALSNTQEARRSAQAMRRRVRRSTVALPPAELIAALQLMNSIVKELGGTVLAFSRVVNAIRSAVPEGPIDPVEVLAYDTARELEFLRRRLGRGAPVANSIAAATGLDIALKASPRPKGR